MATDDSDQPSTPRRGRKPREAVPAAPVTVANDTGSGDQPAAAEKAPSPAKPSRANAAAIPRRRGPGKVSAAAKIAAKTGAEAKPAEDKPAASAAVTGKPSGRKPNAVKPAARRAAPRRAPIKPSASLANVTAKMPALPSVSNRSLSIGAGLVAVGAAVAGFLARDRIAKLLTPKEEAGHTALDLALDQPRPEADDRAPDAFRPDPTAPVPDSEREALRPATGPAPSLVEDRGATRSEIAL